MKAYLSKRRQKMQDTENMTNSTADDDAAETEGRPKDIVASLQVALGKKLGNNMKSCIQRDDFED